MRHKGSRERRFICVPFNELHHIHRALLVAARVEAAPPEESPGGFQRDENHGVVIDVRTAVQTKRHAIIEAPGGEVRLLELGVKILRKGERDLSGLTV